MKTILITALLLSCFTVHAEEIYVKPNILAKQFLAEQDFKQTLINAFKDKASCLENLAQGILTGSNNAKGLGRLINITNNSALCKIMRIK